MFFSFLFQFATGFLDSSAIRSLKFFESIDMSFASSLVVSPNVELSPSSFGFLDSVRDGSQIPDSSRFFSRNRAANLMSKKQKWGNHSHSTELKYPILCEGGYGSVIAASMVANPAGEMAVSAEQKVYNVVMKQAALVKRQLRTAGELDVKPDIVLPGTLSLLNEAYDRCGEVCAEYAKTFYLG